MSANGREYEKLEKHVSGEFLGYVTQGFLRAYLVAVRYYHQSWGFHFLGAFSSLENRRCSLATRSCHIFLVSSDRYLELLSQLGE